MFPTMLVAHVSDKVWSLVTDILSPDHGRQESIDQFETSPYFWGQTKLMFLPCALLNLWWKARQGLRVDKARFLFLQGTNISSLMRNNRQNSPQKLGVQKCRNAPIDQLRTLIRFRTGLAWTPGVLCSNYWVSAILKTYQIANRTLSFRAGNGKWWRPCNYQRKVLIGPEGGNPEAQIVMKAEYRCISC